MQIERIPQILEEIKEKLNYSKVSLSRELKLEVAHKILNIMVSKSKHFGLFVIVGWKDRWNTYTDISDSYQDIFTKHVV